MITSNQFYGGLNRRFDKRVRQLHKFGFRKTDCQIFEESTGEFIDMQMTIFSRKCGWKKRQCISGEFISSACNRLWNDKLAQLLETGTKSF